MPLAASIGRQPVPLSIPLREPNDFPGTVRISSWSAGYNKRRLQETFRAAVISPQFWDSQNMDVWSREGSFQLARGLALIELEAADREYLLYPFNNALYRLPTANFTAASVKKLTSATGAPAWAALTNIYPGAVTPRNAAIWRDQWVIASAENLIRVSSKTEVWSTIAPPAAVTANCVQVGIGPDDRLLSFWEGVGLYAWDGAAHTKIFPPSTSGAGNLAAAPYCDLILRGAGSTIFVLRDSSDVSFVWEYAIEPTGVALEMWLEEPGLRFWPQGGDVYENAVYLVARAGAEDNLGILFRKEKLAPLEPIDYLDTNYATAGQKGLDWAWRCLRVVGGSLLLGGSSREDHRAALFRYFVDQNGQVMMPGAVIPDVVAGPIYSIGILPYSATGAATSYRVHISTNSRTYYKDRDDDATPTSDSATGIIQMSDIDYGTEDKEKVGKYVEITLKKKSTGGTVEVQYRVDPEDPTTPWSSLGFATLQGTKRLPFPNDNLAQGKAGTRFQVLQLRVVLTRATSGTVRDVVSTIAVDVAWMQPPELVS